MLWSGLGIHFLWQSELLSNYARYQMFQARDRCSQMENRSAVLLEDLGLSGRVTVPPTFMLPQMSASPRES